LRLAGRFGGRLAASECVAIEDSARGLESARAAGIGCIVVPVDFYEQVVAPSLGSQRGVVYVLPETASLASMLRAP